MPDTNPSAVAIDRTRLRKTLGFALRHNPWAFGLDLAEDGSTPLGDVVASLRSRLPEFRASSADEAAAAVPPDTLFHGTTDGTSVMAHRDGLRPMGRYYVHLTSAPDYAAGVPFYRANAHVWLVAGVPAEFLVLRIESGGQILPTPSAKSTA